MTSLGKSTFLSREDEDEKEALLTAAGPSHPPSFESRERYSAAKGHLGVKSHPYYRPEEEDDDTTPTVIPREDERIQQQQQRKTTRLNESVMTSLVVSPPQTPIQTISSKVTPAGKTDTSISSSSSPPTHASTVGANIKSTTAIFASKSSGSPGFIMSVVGAGGMTGESRLTTTEVTGTPPSSNQVLISKKLREARRKEIKRELEKSWTTGGSLMPGGSGGEKSGCNWSFVFDPSGRLVYYWSMIVSLAFLYNAWVIIYRFAFDEINASTAATWLSMDFTADIIYLLDVMIHFRIGFLEEGVLQTHPAKLRQHYMNSTIFYIDCLCLLPLDFLYLSTGFNSIFRCFRLVKIYRFWSFLDRTERHTNYPNVFRTCSLFHYILVLFHWNACLYHLISSRGGFGSSDWFSGSRDAACTDVDCDYLHAFYWSSLAVTTIGDLPRY